MAANFSEPQFVEFFDELVRYLPFRRRNQFLHSWVTNYVVRSERSLCEVSGGNGRPAPRMLNVSPTHRCNLRCTGCYAADYVPNREMTAEQFDFIVREAKALGISFIGLLGGEPLLRRDLFPVILQHQNMAFRISTNGTLVNDQVVEFLQRSGNTVLFFSLEGLETETDAWRGKGVYGRLRAAMNRLRSERILFGFSALLHTGNHETVASDAFVGEMREAGARIGLFFPYGPAGVKPPFHLVLSEEDLSRIYARLRILEARYRMLFVMEDHVTPEGAPRYFLEQGCTAGSTVHITPEGDVEPCNAIQFHTANVFHGGLRRALDDAFYREVAACASCHSNSCVAIRHPEDVLSLVRRFGARQSNSNALASLCERVEWRRSACRLPSRASLIPGGKS